MTSTATRPTNFNRRAQPQHRTHTAVRLLTAILWIANATSLLAQDLQSLEQQAIRAATKAVADCVVQIETLGGLETVEGALTSSAPTTGLIVASDGWIVSSAFNFVQQPASILITLPGGDRKPARIVARDRSRMLVLLKVDADSPLPAPMPIAREDLRVGQTAIALGRTFDVARANVSVGIVSATQRIWGKAIQTDANVSPANYGGPLIDLQGRVMGILVPLSPEGDNEMAGNEWYDSGIGFAVPLTDILTRLDTLKEGTDLKPGLLGFAFENSQQLDAPPILGVVKANSPAAVIGLRAGDRLVSLNEVPIELQSHAMHVLKPLYAGDKLRVVAERAGEPIRGEATLVDQLQPYEHAFLGISPSRKPTTEPAPDANQAEKGVFVRNVYIESPAEKAGLNGGDRILRWNDTELDSVEELRKLLANHQPGESINLTWQSKGEQITADILLSGLPTELISKTSDDAEEPQTVNSNRPEAPPAEIEKGRLEWKIPEEPNQGVAFVPTSYQGKRPAGLLVLIGAPSEKDLNEILESWKPICEQHELILIIPQGEDPARWSPTEAGFIRKAIDQAQRRFLIDPERIALYGREAGGAMAYLTAFRHRDTIRGLVIEDAFVPPGIAMPDNEPLQRLAVILAIPEPSKLKEPMDRNAESLRKQKFPVGVVLHATSAPAFDTNGKDQLARWINSLDRL